VRRSRIADGRWRIGLPATVVAVVALGVLASPLAAEAQQAKRPYRIGVLHTGFFEEIPSVAGLQVGLKDLGLEEGRDVTFDIRVTRGMNFHVLAGRDTLIYATLCYGGTGSITATANVDPRVPVAIYESFVAGDHKGALEAQYRLAPLRIAFGLGTFPVVIKEALNMIGIEAGPAVPPVGPMNRENREKLRKVLEEFHVDRYIQTVRGAGYRFSTR